MRVSGELDISACNAFPLAIFRQEIDVERRVRARECHRLWLPLLFVVAKEVNAVPAQRPAERRSDLLILIGHDTLLDEIGCVEPVAAEVAGDRPCIAVCAGLRDRVGQHPGGAPLRGVEPVRHDDELGDCVHAVTRLVLVSARNEVRDLLAVDVDLRVALPRLRDVAALVLPAAWREHGQIHPVAAIDRQVLHLSLVDISAER